MSPVHPLDRPSTTLVVASTAASGLGIVKILLLLAPFAILSSCGNSVSYSVTGVQVFTLRPMTGDLAFMPFLLVPLTGLAAAMMVFISLDRHRRVWRRCGVGMMVGSLVSLAALLVTALLLGNGTTIPVDMLPDGRPLWGFWATASTDALSIVLLTVVLLTDKPRLTRLGEASADYMRRVGDNPGHG
jgi:hypothetical protein